MKELVIQSKRGERIVLVDDDFDCTGWCVRLLFNHTREYAIASRYINGKRQQVYLHHMVAGKPPTGFSTDHIDGSGLNNQRSNLRFVDHSTNMRNRRGIKGYHYNKAMKKFEVRVQTNGKVEQIGWFDCANAARDAYLNAIRLIDPLNLNLAR